jgi:phytoene synthase
VTTAQQVLAKNSKSFSLAAKLLPASSRADIAELYAYCRHVDDAIDLAPLEERPAALAKLRAELDAIYDGKAETRFGEVVHRYQIPRAYPEELIEGMAMDVARTQYRTLDDLLRYCFRVAGVVGLMLCHVWGVTDANALRNAAHLGIGMQLTNICRDVEEDQRDGRMYLPQTIVGDGPDRERIKSGVAVLLAEADRYYASADRGVIALSFRCALAVRAARLIYSAIGHRLRARGCDPFLGRAYVPLFQKLTLVLLAIVLTLAELPRRLARKQLPAPPDRVLGFPHDVVPI